MGGLVKENEVRATVAWASDPAYGSLVATAPVAGAVDWNFAATQDKLEILDLDLGNMESRAMPVKGVYPTSHHFHRLAWGSKGPGEHGVIAGGLENGLVNIWNPSLILK